MNTYRNQISGYLHPAYAEALAEFGVPYLLPQSQGNILMRSIPGDICQDAMGCYPLFTCANWSALANDLRSIGHDLVSLVVVTDPFGKYQLTDLQECFPDIVYAFKNHYVVDLRQPLESQVTSHHHRYIKKSLGVVQIERCTVPNEYLEVWVQLYDILTSRHNIKGIARFSPHSFEHQLQVPGLVMFRAIYQKETVGMLLWYIQDNIGYYHLGAYSGTGYATHSSFALFWTALKYFAAQGLSWLDLGAGAGITDRSVDGLAHFKKGWTSNTRTAYLCGRIFDRTKYNKLVEKNAIPPTRYFPHYRYGEQD